MKPPVRLVEDPTVPLRVRTDLKRAAESAVPYDTAVGLALLHASIASTAVAASTHAAPLAGSVAGATQAVAGANQAGLMGKLLGIAGSGAFKLSVGTAVLVGTAVAGHELATGPRAKTAPSGVLIAPSATLPPVLVDRGPATTPSPAEQVPTTMREAAGVNLPRSEPSRQLDVDAERRREIDQLGQIKSLFDRDPAQAYALAESGHRVFRRGILWPEREALAVLALAKLGRRSEATARAKQFLARYPHSPSRARIVELVAGTER
jgi:hypothetical protein